MDTSLEPFDLKGLIETLNKSIDDNGKGGEGLPLSTFATPLGDMLVAGTDSQLYLLEFTDRIRLEEQCITLQKHLGSPFVQGNSSIIERTEREINEYFTGSRSNFSIPLAIPGSQFQQDVWNALSTIPYGTTKSYGGLARELGDEKAVRAVARTNGENRIAIIVPCHRVVANDGKLTGYAGGIWRKQRLLQLENAVPPSAEGQERLF